MKKIFTLFAVIMMAIAVNAQTTASTSPLRITFAGRGEATTVDQVTVTNVSQPEVEPVTLSGTDILLLADNSEDLTALQNALQEEGLGEPILTPNPSMSDGTLIFDAKEAGPVRVSIYTAGGVLVEQETVQAEEGRNTVFVPSQLHGIYIINIVGKGINHSTRWICNGSKSSASIALGGATQWADETPEFLKKDAIKSTPVNVAILTYKEGDVLRFEGTSGKMTSIVHVSPESSHDVTFDFYKCEDAAGYNYPIVRIGDMLWMLEDLRPMKAPNLIRTSAPEIWQTLSETDSAVFVKDDKAYYTIAGARKMMPKGWEMPSIDEVYAMVKKLQADTTKLGDFLKDRSYEDWPKMLIEGPDTIHLQLMANGFISPQGMLTQNEVTGAWVTRTTINYGHPVSFEIKALDSKLYPLVIHDKRCGFTVRGVRPAPSVYMEMVEKYFPKAEFGDNSASSPKLRRPMQLVEKDGPLGDLYSMGADRKSIFFDYSFTPNTKYDGSTANDKRSGVIHENYAGGWVGENKQLVPLDVNGADYQHHLRKVIAQGNEAGYENVVYASWSKQFRALYPYNATPSVAGEGKVYISIYGDSIHNHAMLNEYRLTLLDKNGDDYVWVMPNIQQWSRRRPGYENNECYLSDVRYEYYARSFNLNCIQDQTGDGIDEIVMNVGDKIAVFDGATMKCLCERQISSDRTYTGYAHMRFDVADVNGDGIEDIVLLADEEKNGGQLYVFDKGQLEEKPIYQQSIHDQLIFCDVKVGHMSGNELPEIAILARGTVSESSDEPKKQATLRVLRLKYNDDMKLEVAKQSTQSVDCFYGLSHRNWVLGNMTLCFGYFRGRDVTDKDGNKLSYNQDLVVGYKLYRWDELEEMPVYLTSFIQADRYTVPADAIIAVQTKKNGKENLVYFEHDHVFCQAKYPRSNSKLCVRWLDDDGKTVKSKGDLCSTLFGWADSQMTRFLNMDNSEETDAHPVLCKFADRERPTYFKYKGHELTFTEPRVYAAIAAAPYYKDLAGSSEAATTWGKVNSVGDSDASSDTFGGSLICGFEYSFSAPFFHSETGADFTLKASAAYTKAVETGETKSYGNSYTAKEDHIVVMQATPCDTYTYEIVRSDNPDDEGCSFILTQPRARRFVHLKLDDYVRITASQRGVAHPQWYLKGTPGKPYSYPRTWKDLARIESKKYPMMLGRDINNAVTYQMAGTSGSVSRSLSLARDTTTTKTVEVGIEAELVFKNNGAKAGVGFNYNHTDQDVHRVGSEFSVKGTVPGLPSENDPEHPQFSWNIVWYYVQDTGGIYPVINYIVTDK
ncbi:MAG: T9SS type A sorting domain-containing protein [Bacteroidaceae bacterium]|nr:T9SS type A sorting domain-containing protein [Bacteroidaceae bacterium]